MRTLKSKRTSRLLTLTFILVLAMPLLGSPSPARAVTPDCGSPAYLVDVTLPNGSRWVMCWEERRLEGIVIHEAYFTPPGGTQRLVLYRGSVAQIHVPYDNNGARLHDVTDYGLGGSNLDDLDQSECPDGQLLSNNGRDVLCRLVAPDGYAYKYYGSHKQAHALTLQSVSGISRYNYIVRWKFFDDGTIEPSIGASGRLQFCTSSSRYGWRIDGICTRGTSHTHNYWWRLDLDVGGTYNDVFQQLTFGGSGESYRPMGVSTTRYETRRSVSQTNFRTFRVYDASIRNPDGHLISYELDPDASHTFRGPSYEPWSRADVYYTRNSTCERYASHNPTYGGCGDDLSDYANGQWVNDAVLWYGHTFHHLARDEDDPRMSTHWSSFRLVPRDMTSTTSR